MPVIGFATASVSISGPPPLPSTTLVIFTRQFVGRFTVYRSVLRVVRGLRRRHLHAVLHLITLHVGLRLLSDFDLVVLLYKRGACAPERHAAVVAPVALDAVPFADLAALYHGVDPATTGETSNGAVDETV